MFEGVFTALVTPFTKGGNFDEKAFRDLVESQIKAGIDGLVAVGSTGESPTVTHEENLRIVEIAIDQAAGRVPVIAGTGSNSTQEALDMTRRAKDIGAAASLQTAPYYNKPNQEGFYRHFCAVADAVDLPVILYNIPGRTAKAVDTATILRLAKHPNIKALKQSLDNLTQLMDVVAGAPKDFTVLSGDDGLTLPTMALGAKGVISVASHLVPEDMVALVRAMSAGELAKAQAIHYRLLPLFHALFIDTNPIPVKYALSLQKRMAESYRLPLYPMADNLKAQLKNVMEELGLLKNRPKAEPAS